LKNLASLLLIGSRSASGLAKNRDNNLEKHDVAVEYEETAYLSSLIIPKDNSNKNEIISLFIDQSKRFNK
jgi:hypothetical protein